MMAYSLTRYRTEKRQEGKTRKMGDRGIARIFLREWRGGWGGHTVSNRGYSPFFCYLNILGCLSKKGSIRGSKAPISLSSPPPPTSTLALEGSLGKLFIDQVAWAMRNINLTRLKQLVYHDLKPNIFPFSLPT